MVYPHKWSPISCKSSAGQGKFAGKRPAFYHCAIQPTKGQRSKVLHFATVIISSFVLLVLMSELIEWLLQKVCQMLGSSLKLINFCRHCLIPPFNFTTGQKFLELNTVFPLSFSCRWCFELQHSLQNLKQNCKAPIIARCFRSVGSLMFENKTGVFCSFVQSDM